MTFRPRTWTEFAEDAAIGGVVLLGGPRATVWFALFLFALVWR